MPYTRLSLHKIELFLHLGWPDAERIQAQTVYLTLDIAFSTPPKACESDELNETVCYAALIEGIQAHLKGLTFRLVEHLSFVIYEWVKKQLPCDNLLTVHLHKHPPLPGLTEGITFQYGDTK